MHHFSPLPEWAIVVQIAVKSLQETAQGYGPIGSVSCPVQFVLGHKTTIQTIAAEIITILTPNTITPVIVAPGYFWTPENY
jgi:hypothetical protein